MTDSSEPNAAASPNLRARDEWKGNGVVKRECRDDYDHKHHAPKADIAKDISQRVAHRRAASGSPWCRMQSAAINGPHRSEHGEKRAAVDQKTPAGADRLLRECSDRRPKDSRSGHHRCVERHGVQAVSRIDEFDHEPAPRRVVHRCGDPEHKRQPVQQRQGERARQLQNSEGERLDRHDRLRRHRHFSFVAAIRDSAGPCAEHKHGKKLAGDGEPDARALPGELVDDQRRGGHLHPGAGVRHEHPRKEPSGVPFSQRAERGWHRGELYKVMTGRRGPHPTATVTIIDPNDFTKLNVKVADQPKN